jgi:hypothetical protein
MSERSEREERTNDDRKFAKGIAERDQKLRDALFVKLVPYVRELLHHVELEMGDEVYSYLLRHFAFDLPKDIYMNIEARRYRTIGQFLKHLRLELPQVVEEAESTSGPVEVSSFHSRSIKRYFKKKLGFQKSLESQGESLRSIDTRSRRERKRKRAEEQEEEKDRS